MSTAATNSTVSQGNLLGQITSMSRPFWMVNIMEMLERLAYYGVRVVVPIYIARQFCRYQTGRVHF
ncbi:MAG: hypothetical protein J7J98_04910 [candidate division Zixibacteria bacterium]|nr:hypothetical protein [candidate division Zixibacteria bacterium]